MEGLRILVTGGYGFYGRHIIPALKEQFSEAQIYVLDKDISGEVVSELAPLVTESVEVDITSETAVIQALRVVRPHAVVHTAGINPPLRERYHRTIERLVKGVNVGGTINMLSAAREIGCKAFVYTSSCCVVTDDLHGRFANIDERWPLSRRSLMYGESKVEAEEHVLAADSQDMATCVLRPAVTFGEADYILGTCPPPWYTTRRSITPKHGSRIGNPLSSTASAALADLLMVSVPSIHACIPKCETPFRLGDGNNLWDVVYVGNVAFAHALAVKNLLTSKSAHGEAMVSSERC